MKWSIRASVAAGLIFGSAAANAVLIQVDYAGTVHTVHGTGFGYAVGDAISGTMLIDTDRVGSTSSSSSTNSLSASYRSTDFQFVTSSHIGVGDTYPESVDVVNFSNRTGPGGRDVVRYQSGSKTFDDGFTESWRAEEIVALDFVAELVGGTLLTEAVSITQADLVNGMMLGSLIDYVFDYIILNDYIYRNEAHFTLSSLSANVRPGQVPEPEALWLLVCGLLALGLIRRRGLA